MSMFTNIVVHTVVLSLIVCKCHGQQELNDFYDDTEAVDLHIPKTSVVELECDKDGSCGICAGVLISKNIIFTSQICAFSAVTSKYRVYMNSTDIAGSTVSDIAVFFPTKAVLLKTQISAHICDIHAKRYLEPVCWERLSDIYTKGINHFSVKQIEQNYVFMKRTLKMWNELEEAEADVNSCATTIPDRYEYN